MAKWKTNFRKDYQLDTPELSEHWEEIIDDLHSSGCPVARSEVGEGYWVVLQDEDVRRVARDWETFSNRDGFMPNRPDGLPFMFPEESDPPFHDHLRAVLNPHLSPRAISDREPEIRAHADWLIDQFISAGQLDVVSQFATALPGRVFCDVIAAMPLADVPMLQSDLHLGVLGPLEERGAAFDRVQRYMDNYLRERQSAPRRGDIVDAILELELPGYEWADKCGVLTSLTLGGLGTTGHVIASAIHWLAEHPEDRARFRSPDGVGARAVEELVRVFAPSPHDGRRVMRDVVVGGVEFAKGDFVMLGFGAACRDPKVFDSPMEIDFDRFPNRHVAFGTGVHRCIGSHLARIQVRVAIETFLKRIPEFKLVDGFEPTFDTGITRSMRSLKVEFPVPSQDGQALA